MADGSLCILGAGTMGAGIAQVAAASGWRVVLVDVDDDVVRRAIEGVHARFDRLVEKGRIAGDEASAAKDRLHAMNDPADLANCPLLIEAIVEDLDAKVTAIQRALASLPDDAIIATNTSSLSITKLGEALGEPRRTVGMHFFNPAPLMKLVEVVAGAQTDGSVVDRVAEIAESWGKKVARAADAPGFIVNHVARPYYLEAFRILEDGYEGPSEIDRAMKQLGGFRMGPLELTDLIGQDVNTATTRSVWQQLDKPPLLHPSTLQEGLVEQGHLGRKSGRGVYDYSGEEPTPAIDIDRKPLDLSEDVAATMREFAMKAAASSSGDRSDAPVLLEHYVLARVLAGLIVQAHLAFERGVASRADIDTALRYGVNYPKGPFEWTDQIGRELCIRWLEALDSTTGAGRFAVPESLRSG